MASATSKQSSKRIWKTSLFIAWQVFKWTFAAILVFGFLAGGIVFGYVSSLVKDEPIRPKEDIVAQLQQHTTTGFVYFNDDTQIGQLRGIDRRMIELKDVPQTVIDAFLATEDDSFFEHPGIDFMATARAVKQKLLNEPVQTGGSTITQQVARNYFLSLDVTDSRKVKEIFLALRLERYLSKEQILEAYLNRIPFGNGSTGYNVYGIKAAALGIFNVENLSDLNIAQAAYLAGLPQSPSEYSAFSGSGEFDEEGFQKALDRQGLVLRRMLEEGMITRAEYDEAVAFDIRSSMAKPEKKAYSTYPYLMIEAELQAAKILLMQQNPTLTEADLRKPENQVLVQEARESMLDKGYRIYTTIDKTIYDSMQDIAANPENFTPDNYDDKGIEQIGAIMIDNDTGAILGMMEGRGFHITEYNHATQATRQPGSTMKPIAAFLPALESGQIQPGSIIDDVPLLLPDWTKGVHIPNNWDMTFHGLITARTALNQSYNIPALELFNNVVGIEKAWNFAKSLGITTLTEDDNHARTGVIGGLSSGVTVEELTSAYTSIPNKGVFNDAYMIRKIENAEGEIIYEHRSEPKSVFSEQTAYLMTDMLKTVLTNGTGTRARRNFEYANEIAIAGKTGSTQNDRDAWFMGYTPDITVGVWAGYDQDHLLTTRIDGNPPQGPGTQRAMNIWALIMNAAVEKKPELFPNKEFEKAEDIVSYRVSSVSGMLPSALVNESGKTHSDLFNKKYIPKEEDNKLQKMQVVVYNGLNYIPQEGTPSDFVSEKLVVVRDKPMTDLMKQIEEALKGYSPSEMPTRRGRPMTVKDYYPTDVALSAPTEVDPRVEDGSAPNPAGNVSLLTVNETTNKITFEASSSADVVGYRLYRSLNGGAFVTRPEQNVRSGDELVAFDYISPGNSYAYYVTAVDISGKESAPSAIVTYGNSELPDDVFPPELGGDDPGIPDLPGLPGLPGGPTPTPSTDPGQQGAKPSVPTGVTAGASADGLSLELSWSANPIEEGVIRYDIYYSSVSADALEKIGSTNTTRYVNLTQPYDGWYAVRAVTNRSESDLSAAVQYRSTAE